MFGENFMANYIYIVSFALFAIGFSMLVFNKNLIKKCYFLLAFALELSKR